MVSFTIPEINELSREALIRAGLSADDAAIIKEVYLEAELWGRKSHGFRLIPWTLEQMKDRKIGEITIEQETPVSALLDGEIDTECCGSSGDDWSHRQGATARHGCHRDSQCLQYPYGRLLCQTGQRPRADWHRDGAHSGPGSTLWRRRVNPGDESACYRDSSPVISDNSGYGYFRSVLPS